MKHLRLAALFLTIILLCGCSTSVPNSRTFFAMDTIMTVTAYGSENVGKQCEEYVVSLEQLLSAQKIGSDTERLNTTSEVITISNETSELLEIVLNFCRETDGIYDPTVYPLVKEWGFIDGNYSVPEAEQISELMKKIGYEQIELDGNNARLPNEVEIDFGACAKGFAADKLTKILQENDVTSALLDLGGNIQAIGCKADGTEWKIGIADPSSPSESLGTLLLSDCAAVTSGNYQRYFTDENGIKRCHIIDPRTGYPAESGISSVTVVTKSGTRADMLSTALFIMGTYSAADFWRESGDFEMLIVTENGELMITEGIFEKFTLNENYAEMEVIRIEK